MWSQHYTAIFRRSSADNSVIGGRVGRILYLIKAFMGGLNTCKPEEDPFKNEGARVVIKYLPLYVYADFLCFSMAVKSTV